MEIVIWFTKILLILRVFCCCLQLMDRHEQLQVNCVSRLSKKKKMSNCFALRGFSHLWTNYRSSIFHLQFLMNRRTEPACLEATCRLVIIERFLFWPAYSSWSISPWIHTQLGAYATTLNLCVCRWLCSNYTSKWWNFLTNSRTFCCFKCNARVEITDSRRWVLALILIGTGFTSGGRPLVEASLFRELTNETEL